MSKTITITMQHMATLKINEENIRLACMCLAILISAVDIAALDAGSTAGALVCEGGTGVWGRGGQSGAWKRADNNVNREQTTM